MPFRLIPILVLMLCGAFQGTSFAKPPRKAASSPPVEAEPAPVTFQIAPRPSWVRPSEPGSPPSSGQVADGGIAYLLTDEQVNIQPRARYVRSVRHITSESGVQNGASVEASFDPAYQRLIIHHLRVIRKDMIQDRLSRSQVKLLQREESLESHIYDGSYTANCQLEDVRVGDTIDYEYTIEGENPVMSGKYSDRFASEWSVAVEHAVVRLVYPTTRQMFFKCRNRDIQPQIKKSEDIVEWLWDERSIPGRRVDSHTPVGYNPYGSIQVSEFADWRAVVDWALPLYVAGSFSSPEIDEQVASLRKITDPEARILAALRFVQDEIRYLGIESGAGSHRPTPPNVVMRRRFGDCKDKTLLLASLLQSVDITATPALVNSVLRQDVSSRHPSPGVFDHVILHVKLGGDSYWLDATRSSQRGSLKQIPVSAFGYALLLQPGSAGLTPVQPWPESLPSKRIVETYRVGIPGRDTTLEVVTDFFGAQAEAQRAQYRSSTPEKIGQLYLEFYARRYPGVTMTKPPELREIASQNGCEIREYYRIGDAWEINHDKNRYEFSLFPQDVYDAMGRPGSTVRTDPLGLSHPVKVTHELRTEMFEKWPVRSGSREVANAYFRHTVDSSGNGFHLSTQYSYETLTDRVSRDDLPAYDAALRAAQDKLGFVLYYQTAAQLAAESSPSSTTPAKDAAGKQANWLLILLTCVVSAMAAAVGVRFFQASKLPTVLPPSLTAARLDGLGGWLLLVGFGHICRPFLYGSSLVDVGNAVFDLQAWQSLTQIGQPSYHPLRMPTLIFEVLFNALLLVYSVLLCFLFLRKRAVWPRCFIAMLIIASAGLILDAVLCAQISGETGMSTETSKGIMQSIWAMAVWIPYALKSQRVKATFRR